MRRSSVTNAFGLTYSRDRFSKSPCGNNHAHLPEESHLRNPRSANSYYQHESLIHKPQNLFQMLVLISFTQKYSWVDFGKYAFRTHTYTQNKLQLRSFLLPSGLPLDLGAGCGSEEAASSQHKALLLSPLCRLVRTLNSLEEISFSSKLSFRKTQIPTRMKITK